MTLDDKPTPESNGNHMYYYRGIAWLYEGFCMWLAKRLPGLVVFHVISRITKFADEHDIDTYNLAEIASAWMVEKTR